MFSTDLYRKFQSNLKLLFNCISIISNCIVIILICGAIIAQVGNHRNDNNAGACADTFCSLRCADLVLTEHQNFTIKEPDFGLLEQDNIFKLCSDKFDYSSTLHTSLNLFLPVILYITIQMQFIDTDNGRQCQIYVLKYFTV